MNSKLGIQMLEDFRESALREIADAARERSALLRQYAADEPFGLDDARRFDAVADAISALWPRKEA